MDFSRIGGLNGHVNLLNRRLDIFMMSATLTCDASALWFGVSRSSLSEVGSTITNVLTDSAWAPLNKMIESSLPPTIGLEFGRSLVGLASWNPR